MRLLRKLLLLTIILIIAAGVFALWFSRELQRPHAHDKSGQYIEIARGTSSTRMLQELADAGVIRRAWVAEIYLRLFAPNAKLKAGEYRFPSPISTLGVIRKLEEGEERLNHFTVIEGWTRWDIAGAMARIPELKIDAAQALELMNDTSLISDLDPDADNLEGYLFPDTYNFPPNVAPHEMIATMVRRFRQVWKKELAAPAQTIKRTPHEIVTIASLIETEAKLKDERPLVASVIYNRLQAGMPLGVDSSLIYALRLAGKWHSETRTIYQSDLEQARNSPYNTRVVKGLPPGPIASPGERSLQAAVAPAQTDYLYYVRNPDRDDGAHNFYANEADFARGVQALRAWEQTHSR
jgi:UPF0755 protein